jgi:hypothetical protein
MTWKVDILLVIRQQTSLLFKVTSIKSKEKFATKIKGYLLQNLCAGSVNNEKDENVAICHLFCSLLKWI